MKKLFAILSLIAFIAVLTPHQADAQISKHVTLVKDSVVNADTSVITLDKENTVRSYTLVATKASGSAATSKAYLQANVDGTNWVTLDSLIMTNQTTNIKTFSVTPLIYNSYRFQVIGAGTVKLKPIQGWVLKRSN